MSEEDKEIGEFILVVVMFLVSLVILICGAIVALPFILLMLAHNDWLWFPWWMAIVIFPVCFTAGIGTLTRVFKDF